MHFPFTILGYILGVPALCVTLVSLSQSLLNKTLIPDDCANFHVHFHFDYNAQSRTS